MFEMVQNFLNNKVDFVKVSLFDIDIGYWSSIIKNQKENKKILDIGPHVKSPLQKVHSKKFIYFHPVEFKSSK